MGGSGWAEAAGGSLHDVRLPFFNHEGTVFRAIIFAVGRIDHKSAVEALPSAQLFLSYLVTHGTGNAVFCGSIFLRIVVERKMRENLAQAALQLRLITRDGHVAVGAPIFDRFS